jgi:hypothetical protein
MCRALFVDDAFHKVWHLHDAPGRVRGMHAEDSSNDDWKQAASLHRQADELLNLSVCCRHLWEQIAHVIVDSNNRLVCQRMSGSGG